MIAVLGVLIGALSVATVNKYNQSRRMLRTEYIDWRKLNLILQQIDEHYVDSIDRKKVTEAAVTAALATLDPHSVYLPPVEKEQSDESLAGAFDGIGIQFNVPNDTAVVIEAIPGGPAQKLGMLAGDRLIYVDSVLIAGVKFPQDSMVRRMKGPAGTKVTVTVKRGEELIPFEITRGKIPVHSVSASFMADAETGYIRLDKFSFTTASEVALALEMLNAQGMKKLVFDIRSNSGGYLDQALKISDMFLPKDSLVVYMEGRKRPREEYKASGRGHYKDIPMCVLIDEGSASSSEIFAGAMQGNHRARIVGRRSFGKGLVQEPVNFTDGSGMRLTVARFYTPDGRCIQKPYTPDYEYEVFKRYGEGEMVNADSMNVAKGGILPDVFVPIDTTKATQFYISCNKKATAMRFAADFFDHHRDISEIDDYEKLQKFLDRAGLEREFLAYAKKKDGLEPKGNEWAESRDYMLTQAYALVGRYSKLGDNAFYHFYLDIDECYKAAYCAMKE